MDRSSRPDVRNPLLALPAATAIAALPSDTQVALRALLLQLAADARQRAETSWRQHKGPMALYWRSVSVYARHTARLLGRKGAR